MLKSKFLLLFAAILATLLILISQPTTPSDYIQVEGVIQIRVHHDGMTYLVVEDENQTNYFCPIDTDVPNGYTVTVIGRVAQRQNIPALKKQDLFLTDCRIVDAEEPGGWFDW